MCESELDHNCFDRDQPCAICDMDTADFDCSACKRPICCDCTRTCIECRAELCAECSLAVQISDGIQDDFCPAHVPSGVTREAA